MNSNPPTQRHHITLINPSSIRAPRPTYSQVASTTLYPTSRLITTSGQVGTTRDGVTPSSFTEQADLVFENLRVCLEGAGARVKDIVKLTFYIVDIPRNRDQFSAPLQRFLTDDEGRTWRPPSSLIGVAALSVPEWLLEVEATAVIPPPSPEPVLPEVASTSTPSTLFSSFPFNPHPSGPDIAATLAPIVPPTIKSPPPTSAEPGDTIRSIDVIIIGAGLSGLTAALDVQKAGLSCIVLEARDRVGGKTLSKKVKVGEKKGMVDIGAAWFNPKTQPRIAELVRKFGGESVVQNVKGEKVIEVDGGKGLRYGEGMGVPVDPKVLQDLKHIHILLETHAAALDLDNLKPSPFDNESVADFIRRNDIHETAYQVMNTTVKAILGVDVTELSLYYFLVYIKSAGSLHALESDRDRGAQAMRVREGMGSLAPYLASLLSPHTIHLSSPVTSIHNISPHSNIATITPAPSPPSSSPSPTSPSKIFHAKKIILSIPTPLYTYISFSPALPPSKSTATSNTRLGFYAKTILVYKDAWWRLTSPPLSGAIESLIPFSPVALVRDTSTPDVYALTCFHVGPASSSFCKLEIQEREKGVKDSLISVLGEEYRGLVEGTEEVVWMDWSEEWSEGAPCPVWGVGAGIGGIEGKEGEEGKGKSGLDVLREVVGDWHFIGTETGRVWVGYIEGAVESGERGGREVVECLRGVAKMGETMAV